MGKNGKFTVAYLIRITFGIFIRSKGVIRSEWEEEKTESLGSLTEPAADEKRHQVAGTKVLNVNLEFG